MTFDTIQVYRRHDEYSVILLTSMSFIGRLTALQYFKRTVLTTLINERAPIKPARAESAEDCADWCIRVNKQPFLPYLIFIIRLMSPTAHAVLVHSQGPIK